ncbi:MAG: DUF1836 domain-containing protein [Syntrophomonas sp.]|nr:DUF1836 domain-containing protein [Syntrophomonas sp.]
MDFDRNYIEKLVEEISLPQLKFSDMPTIELYMEQMLSLIESKFNSSRRGESDKVLTRTMINNYTKLGLLMPPKNKKYSREHMMLLTLIYDLKNVLSINDIKSLFSPILNNIATRDDDLMSLEEIYTAFLELNNIEFDNFYNSFVHKLDLIYEKTEELEKDNKDISQMFLFVIMLVAQSNAQKRLAERIIDDFFALE